MDKSNTKCACGCGAAVSSGRKFIQGHNQRGKPSPRRVQPTGDPPLCKCGCGENTIWSPSRRRWNSFIQGHQHRGAKHSEEALAKMRAKAKLRSAQVAQMNRERVWTEDMRRKASAAKRKNPLPHQFRPGPDNPSFKHGQTYRRPSASVLARHRRNLIDARGFACEDCGVSPEPEHMLHMHHLDDDTFNNVPDNLRLLCVACHNKITHGAT